MAARATVNVDDSDAGDVEADGGNHVTTDSAEAAARKKNTQLCSAIGGR